MSVDPVSDESSGVDMLVEDFGVQKCVNGDVIFAFTGDFGDGVRGGPFTVRIPKDLLRQMEMYFP